MQVHRVEQISMITRDGIRLDADLYRPDQTGEFPVLLMRQPYGRKIASTLVYAHPIWYASQGYIVVIQDVRGRGTSEGEFKLFSHEVEDGIDTINWVSQLPFSNGKVGMYGFSYQGMTQLYAAGHPALGAICPAMVADDLYHDWAYENGAFCLQANLGWALQLAAETARLKGDQLAYQALFPATRNLPLYDLIPSCPDIMTRYAPDSFYHDWLNHPEYDDYWQKLSPKLDHMDIPMLHIGGWFDFYLRGTVNLYHRMVTSKQSLQKLIIGPWGHFPWGPIVGNVNYGIDANSSIDQLQIRWFDHFLKGIDTGLMDEKAIALFDLGDKTWHNYQTWPSSGNIFYLASTGLANIRSDSGTLEKVPPQFSQDIIVHDPYRPVPSLGGHSGFPFGSFDRSSIDNRFDVLTYTHWLSEELSLIGEIELELDCDSDAISFDISAILSIVDPAGKVYNFTQGYIRITSHQPSELIKIKLNPTCTTIKAGLGLRLSLSLSCFPAYPINPGNGKLPKDTSLIEAQIITLKVKSGGSLIKSL